MDFIIFILRVILPILSIFIVLRCFLSMKKNQRGNRTLIVLKNIITGEEIPIKYWENSIGRDKNCDIIINEATVSREHAVLFRRKKGWLISDTGSKSGININGEKVVGQAPVYIGDNISMGSCSFKLIKASESEVVKNPIERMTLKPIRSKSLLFLVLIFHGLITLEALFSKGLTGFDNILDFLDFLFPMGALFCISFIFYFFSSVIFKRVTFELETLGIFLSGIGILTIGNYDIKEVYDYLKTQKGYGFFSSSKQDRALHSLMIVAAQTAQMNTELGISLVISTVLVIAAQMAENVATVTLAISNASSS